MLSFSVGNSTSKAMKRKSTKSKVLLEKEKASALEHTVGNVLSYKSLNLSNINEVEIPTTTKHLILNDNPIKNLDGLACLPNLENLELKQTSISNLKGFPALPAITTIVVSDTPFSSYQTYKTALLILYPTLKRIDGQVITRSDRILVSQYDEKCQNLVRNGWIPTSRIPSSAEVEQIRMQLTTKERSRRSSHIAQQTAKEISEKQNGPTKVINLSEYLSNKISEQEAQLEELYDELECKAESKEKQDEEIPSKSDSSINNDK